MNTPHATSVLCTSLTLAALVTFAGCATTPATPNDGNTLVLGPGQRLGPGARKEVSGIVRGRRDPSIFWTINDSGDEPRVYPVRADGSVVGSVREPTNPGVLLGGAINVDWEDIALDASGRIIVADFGNNSNARADLALIFVPEPEPTVERAVPVATVLFRYPDQPALPAPRDNFNFDAEALFTVGDEVFILTKHRSDTRTTLYRLALRTPGVVNTLERLGDFDVLGRATGADASPDGLKLVLLTYDRIWLFTRDRLDRPFFESTALSRPYVMHDGDSDSEAICFADEGTLLIADEARGRVYRVGLGEIR